MNSFTFLFKAMKETHEQRKTKIDIDEFRSKTINITLMQIMAINVDDVIVMNVNDGIINVNLMS